MGQGQWHPGAVLGVGEQGSDFCASRGGERTLTPALLGRLWGVHGASWGSPGEDPSPPTMLQASRKAGTRGKAAATKQAQRGSSNVFSMFEQAQIQEFKEVSAPPQHRPCTPSLEVVLAPGPALPTPSTPSCLPHWGGGCSQLETVAPTPGLQLH